MILAMVAAVALVPQTVATIDPKHRLVEGVASDGTTIWASSLIDRQILQCRKSCTTTAIPTKTRNGFHDIDARDAGSAKKGTRMRADGARRKRRIPAAIR